VKAIAVLLLSAALFGQPVFDAVDVHPSEPGTRWSHEFVPGGRMELRGMTVAELISFAYGVDDEVITGGPAWLGTEIFDIIATARRTPDEGMKSMLQAVLADRFKLAMHSEKRELPVLGLVLAKPGKTGPQLQAHAAGSDCPTNATADGPAPTATVAGGFPALCNGIFGMPASTPGRVKMGGRNLTLKFIADSLSAGANRGRPMTDQTGLSGTFDFTLEFTPELTGPLPPGATFQPDASGPTLEQALREQLGLKLESSKTTMDVLVLDHLERPSEN
jgi:uncharacterized protein (TIGR03435 family)